MERANRRRLFHCWAFRGNAPHQGVYTTFNRIREIRRTLGLKVCHGNVEIFEGYDEEEVRRRANEFATSNPMTPRYECDFWGKLFLVFLIVPFALWVIHYGSNVAYAKLKCDSFRATFLSPPTPLCKALIIIKVSLSQPFLSRILKSLPLTSIFPPHLNNHVPPRRRPCPLYERFISVSIQMLYNLHESHLQ